jgi:hypothetical protein
MEVTQAIRCEGDYQQALALIQMLKDEGVQVALWRKDRKQLERAQRQAQKQREQQQAQERRELEARRAYEQAQQAWRRSPEYRAQQELLERHRQEQRELSERHNRERQELYERHEREQQELEQQGLPGGWAQWRQVRERHEQEERDYAERQARERGELEERHDRERQDVGLQPIRDSLLTHAAAPSPEMVQVLFSDLNQVAISLVSTGAAVAIAKAVKKFRKSSPACKVEVQGEPHPAQGGSPSPSQPHST